MAKHSSFRHFKTSPEIIRLAVMLYDRFPLSLRNVEDLLHERGIEISHETVRFWWNRFGPMCRSTGLRKGDRFGLSSSLVLVELFWPILAIRCEFSFV